MFQYDGKPGEESSPRSWHRSTQSHRRCSAASPTTATPGPSRRAGRRRDTAAAPAGTRTSGSRRCRRAARRRSPGSTSFTRASRASTPSVASTTVAADHQQKRHRGSRRRRPPACRQRPARAPTRCRRGRPRRTRDGAERPHDAELSCHDAVRSFIYSRARAVVKSEHIPIPSGVSFLQSISLPPDVPGGSVCARRMRVRGCSGQPFRAHFAKRMSSVASPRFRSPAFPDPGGRHRCC